MKTVTITIKVPKDVRIILTRFFNEKEIEKMLREECQEFLWDIYHAFTRAKAKLEDDKKKVA